jgi:hypothetical protein
VSISAKTHLKSRITATTARKIQFSMFIYIQPRMTRISRTDSFTFGVQRWTFDVRRLLRSLS